MIFGTPQPEDILEQALQTRNLDVIKKYVQQDNCLQKLLDRSPNTLVKLIAKDSISILEICLGSGKMDMSCAAVTKALHFMCRHRSGISQLWPLNDQSGKFMYCMTQFFKAGADFSGKDKSGRTLLHVLLYPYMSGKTIWNVTESYTFTKFLEIVLQKSPGLASVQDDKGNTPLHLILMTDEFDHRAFRVFEALLEITSNNMCFNHKNETPRDIALRLERMNAFQAIETKFNTKSEPCSPAVVKKAAAPQAAPPPILPVADIVPAKTDIHPQWQMPSSTQIACVDDLETLGYRITHIFDFEKQERLVITFNTKSGKDTVQPPIPFDDVQDTLLAKATTMFIDKGGVLPEKTMLKVKPPLVSAEGAALLP